MNLKEIQGIIKDFESSSLTILELELDNFKLRLSKQASLLAANAPVETNPSVTILESPSHATPVVNPACVPVKSPLVGTFYASTTPNGEPFVTVGKAVHKGETVCIIEAMKIMNEITSPVAGIVERIDVKNGQVVGYDQVLITLHTGDTHGQ
jgi:acetyl-CoA carboxylase biotin carboxyl carrier protein